MVTNITAFFNLKGLLVIFVTTFYKMDYTRLPVEERIEKAAEYCVLLADDERPHADMLDEISGMFLLTRSQAEQAYLLMRRRYKNEYKNAVRRRLNHAWAALFVSGIITVFYGGIASELGLVFYIVAVFFGLCCLAVIAALAQMYFEKSLSPKKLLALKGVNSNLTRSVKYSSSLEKAGVVPFLFLLFAVIFFIINIWHPNLIDIKRLKEVDDLHLIESVYKKRTGGKTVSYYYVFHFAGYPHEFRIEKDFYRYGDWQIRPEDFAEGDRISIQLENKYAERMLNRNEKKKIKIVNLFHKDRWLVNHTYRNQQVKKEDKRNFYIFSMGFIVSCIGAWLWLRFIKKPDLWPTEQDLLDPKPDF